MAGRTHFGFSLRVALPPSHGFAARRPRRREVIFNPREVLARGEGVHRIADESTLAEVFSLRQSLHKRWVALARRVDEIPGAQTLRTLAGLESWLDRCTFSRWVVERRLGIPYHEPPADPRARVTRNGYQFEPREDAADRQVLGPFHEVQTRSFVRRHFADGPARGIFIDVGAHCGSLSLPFESCFERVLSIEPRPDNYRALERNIALNRLEQKVRPFLVAAGAADAQGTLFLKGDETSSLVSAEASLGSLSVAVRALDGILTDAGGSPSDVRLLKVDVEGAELQVLAGAQRLFAEGSPMVILEANSPAARAGLESLMDQLGYVLLRVADGRNLCFKRFSRRGAPRSPAFDVDSGQTRS
jgi:FkbM family methyltransferase